MAEYRERQSLIGKNRLSSGVDVSGDAIKLPQD